MSEFHHDGFVTTGTRPFQRDSFPMRLFQKAKRDGIWDPYALDFSVDKATWAELSDLERDLTLRQMSLFQAGEESVTLDLLPLIMAVAQEGRIEEEIYLTSFLWEEAKHTEFFHRFLNEVAGVAGEDLTHYHTPSYKKLFYEELPETMWRLQKDPSPRNQLAAAITYNMIIEGVLAETGYYGFYESLARSGRPRGGLIEGVDNLKRDESRHIAFGVYLISRLLAANPDLWPEAEARLTELMPLAMAFVQESLAAYDEMPYGMTPEMFTDYATGQFQKRYARLQKARDQSLADVENVAFETDAA